MLLCLTLRDYAWASHFSTQNDLNDLVTFHEFERLFMTVHDFQLCSTLNNSGFEWLFMTLRDFEWLCYFYIICVSLCNSVLLHIVPCKKKLATLPISLTNWPFVCLFVCVGPGYCIQCGSSNPLGFIGFSLKPKVLGVCNAPSTNGSYGYIGIGGGNLLTLPTPVVKPNTTPAVI